MQRETAVTCTPREGEREERSSDLLQSSGDIVYLVPDGPPSSLMRSSVHCCHKKARATCYAVVYDVDLCKQLLTCTGEAEREINVKHMCGSSTISFVITKSLK